MRIILQVLSGITISLSLTSCGGLSYDLSSTDSLVKTQSLIPEYMYYQTDGSCTDGTLVFNVLVAGGIKLWTDPTQILTAQAEIYLNKDGTYHVHYREFDFSNATPQFETTWSSTYSIDEASGVIKFESLGLGRIVNANGTPTLDLQFTVNIHSTELSGKTGRFRLLQLLSGYNTDRGQYCQTF